MEWMPPPDGDHRLRGCQGGAIDLQQELLEGSLTQRRARCTRLTRMDRDRAVQILLGHTNIENTVRYLGVDIDDALTLSERTEI